MSSQKNFVFVTVPFTDTRRPLIAPAILRSITESAGQTAMTIDFNAEFMNALTTKDRPEEYAKFFYEESVSDQVLGDILEIFLKMAQRILSFSPICVGISVFTTSSRVGTKYLAWAIKKMNPKVKIIIGGTGTHDQGEDKSTFAEDLKESGLIDAFFYGDAEKSLYNYIVGGGTSGKIVNITGLNSHSWKQMTNQEIEQLPYPNYDDYDFTLYDNLGTRLPILGSRGCVAKCTFCNVHAYWKKFTWRSGEHIFNEMVYNSTKYGLTKFAFTDSLINGNIKEYRRLMELLAEHNSTLPEEKKLTWSSYFLLRSKNAFTEEDWQLTSEGGGRNLVVGIETLSDPGRVHMKKGFTNADIDYAFDMAQKYGGIGFLLLFFTGYVTETEEDQEFRVQWLKDHVKYQNVITGISAGRPLTITDGTYLKEYFNELGLVATGSLPDEWENPATGSTPGRRLAWHRMFYQAAVKYGYNIIDDSIEIRYSLEQIERTQ